MAFVSIRVVLFFLGWRFRAICVVISRFIGVSCARVRHCAGAISSEKDEALQQSISFRSWDFLERSTRQCALIF